MEILEILLAVVLWALFAYFGRRKRASRAAEASAEPAGLEIGGDEAPGGEGSGRRAPVDFRDLVRQLRDGWLGAEEPEEAPRPARALPVEPPLLPPLLPPVPVEARIEQAAKADSRPSPRRRRSALAVAVLEDLRSGRESLARAMLLREILGPPVALRGGGGTDRAGTDRWAG